MLAFIGESHFESRSLSQLVKQHVKNKTFLKQREREKTLLETQKVKKNGSFPAKENFGFKEEREKKLQLTN